MSKREFCRTYLNYLGYIVGGGELKIDPSKVEVIVNSLKPDIAKEVGIFLEVVEIKTDASEYAMGVVLMEHKGPICLIL